MIDCVTTNATDQEMFQCGNLYISGGSFLNNIDQAAESSACYSGIVCTGKVGIVNCDVVLDSGSKTYDPNYDCNLVYEAAEVNISGGSITCRGNQRTNIVNQGKANISGGCHIYLQNDKASICHATTTTTADGIFTGNYVEYYSTYMRFGSICGNMFNHKATGSSSAYRMILQCSTCMCDNHFTGSAVYVDGQNRKHIIDRNLHDNGLTVGSAASGSINTNNLQY